MPDVSFREIIMRLLNIASGSAGNATYIGTDNTHILIDTGVTRKRMVEGLKKASLSLDDIDAILITHEHSDHIASLGVLERTREIPVYATPGTIEAVKNYSPHGKYDHEVLNAIEADKEFRIKDINIRAMRIDHDAAEPVCFRLDGGGKSAAVVTDLGEYNEYLIDGLKGLDMLMLEANHDIRMLQTGPYPYPVKMRILGSGGHLSNEASGMMLSRLLHDEIKHIMLAHISRENNTRDIAKMAVENEIELSDNKYRVGDFEIVTLAQNDTSRLFEI